MGDLAAAGNAERGQALTLSHVTRLLAQAGEIRGIGLDLADLAQFGRGAVIAREDREIVDERIVEMAL